MRERLINRRQQGDLGEASAIEWLTSIGAVVLIPLGHSPDYDLVAEIDRRLWRIQVKTSTVRADTRGGREQYEVQLSTLGGNRSWTGVSKRFDPDRADYVFVLAGDGRRWVIPSRELGPRGKVTVGGPRYSEYEVSQGQPINEIVYGGGSPTARIAARTRGSADVGESGEPVKFVPRAEWVRIPPPPSVQPRRLDRPSAQESFSRSGQSVIGAKRRTGIPRRVFEEIGLEIGDRLRFRPDGPGRMIIERIDPAA